MGYGRGALSAFRRPKKPAKRPNVRKSLIWRKAGTALLVYLWLMLYGGVARPLGMC